MKMISYNDLAKLRLRGFLPKGTELYVEKSGMEIVTGLGGFEQFGETIFGWRQGRPFKTVEVSIDLEDALMEVEVIQRIINKLGLPIKKGMKLAELISLFGLALSDKPGRAGTRLAEFLCGDSDKYVLGCHVHNRKGLMSFSWRARTAWITDEFPERGQLCPRVAARDFETRGLGGPRSYSPCYCVWMRKNFCG
ncbi:MAG TPA: hypothetical protein VFZ59_06820 [Verrucomicrobiae bacterium]|nr:hypothetical protein [Verrucomicrobiae bacterium]